jgi:hypothetical protein
MMSARPGGHPLHGGPRLVGRRDPRARQRPARFAVAGCVSARPDGRGQSSPAASPARRRFRTSLTAPVTPEPDVQWRAVISHGGPARGSRRSCPRSGALARASARSSTTRAAVRGRRAGRAATEFLDRSSRRVPGERGVASGADERSIQRSLRHLRCASEVGNDRASLPRVFQRRRATRSGFGDVAIGAHAVAQRGLDPQRRGRVERPHRQRGHRNRGLSAAFEACRLWPASSRRRFPVASGRGVSRIPTRSPGPLRAHRNRQDLQHRRGLGRRWSPMAEVIADRDLRPMPARIRRRAEIQILSRRLHVLAGTPAGTAERPRGSPQAAPVLSAMGLRTAG